MMMDRGCSLVAVVQHQRKLLPCVPLPLQLEKRSSTVLIDSPCNQKVWLVLPIQQAGTALPCTRPTGHASCRQRRRRAQELMFITELLAANLPGRRRRVQMT
ncbi:Os03g0187350 [Oryza sativa Japonica Group]|uniref:Os03g0187350 protein n=3 Tax=Oryza TaxID=4527 RepID=C7J0E4_ORYSJ|nr:hypothetical protein EE612_015755 [Oryza sativa]KAF2937695.1 hypothetical protein DAI22_03g068000 [Oryza sativa Japonica Group]BAH92021.1 Os03g0187350 [Oryza sativa Japonica Group]BAS82686.1 Os03g0187350 [Oryza sativa Japonica Group]|eukprot:NP_001173293.1 Os03g0187350 [Oryza sativa Japonica Group]